MKSGLSTHLQIQCQSFGSNLFVVVVNLIMYLVPFYLPAVIKLYKVLHTYISNKNALSPSPDDLPIEQKYISHLLKFYTNFP